MIVLKWSIVSFDKKKASELMPEAVSLQQCNLSSEKDLKAAILHKRAVKSKEGTWIKKNVRLKTQNI